jgi:hypothetical protein
MRKIYYLILVLFAFSQQIIFADTNPTKNSLQNTKENITVYGPWVTESWSMSYPYNMLCPDDPYSSRKCLAGEIPVAFAHIINCHKNIDDVYFDDSDDYFSDPIYIDDDYLIYNFPSFPELNVYLDSIRYDYNNNLSLDYELISALNFACGIATNHQYVYGGTILQNVYHVFVDKFNYNNATYVSTINDDFYVILKNNMIEGKPAILAISAPSYGKIVICDGYASVTDKYHIKFLWDGAYDGWYILPDGLPSGFNTIDVAVVDIEPPAYSVDELPNDAFILHNFPNPFRTSTKFSFSSNNHIQNAELKIYNIKGQLVRDFSIVNPSPSRSVSVIWDGKDKNGQKVSPGVYLYQLCIDGEYKAERKCLLIE